MTISKMYGTAVIFINKVGRRFPRAFSAAEKLPTGMVDPDGRLAPSPVRNTAGGTERTGVFSPGIPFSRPKRGDIFTTRDFFKKTSFYTGFSI